jgi:hypothetical protein
VAAHKALATPTGLVSSQNFKSTNTPKKLSFLETKKKEQEVMQETSKKTPSTKTTEN